MTPAGARALLLGGGVGIPPLFFLAESLVRSPDIKPLAFFGSELPFPFELAESRQALAGVESRSDAQPRRCSNPGISLADSPAPPACPVAIPVTSPTWPATGWAPRTRPTRQQCGVYACGPEPMLLAAKALAAEFQLPSQLCLEEFMACAVGGCAGCAIRVETAEGPAMRRVCVDGPVFAGETVYAEAGLA